MNQESSVDLIYPHTMRLLVLADVLREKEAGETDAVMMLMRHMRVRVSFGCSGLFHPSVSVD